MARRRLFNVGISWDNGGTIKNGPDVTGAETPQSGPNAWIGGADMNITARPARTSPKSGGA